MKTKGITKAFVILATVFVLVAVVFWRGSKKEKAPSLDAFPERQVSVSRGNPLGDLLAGLQSYFSGGNVSGAGQTTADATEYNKQRQKDKQRSGTESVSAATDRAVRFTDRLQKELGGEVFEVQGRTVGQQLRDLVIGGRSAESVRREAKREAPGRAYQDMAGNVYSNIHDATMAIRARRAVSAATGIPDANLTIRKTKVLPKEVQSTLRAENRIAKAKGSPKIYFDLRGNAYATAQSAAAAIRAQRGQ